MSELEPHEVCPDYQADEDERMRCAYDGKSCPFKGNEAICGEKD